MSLPWLPTLLREMAEAFDLRTALRFAELWGGQFLHLPAAARPDHPVAQELGLPVLAWLISRHDHLERVVVPKGPRRAPSANKAAIAALLQRRPAPTLNEMARATGLHVRQVQNIVAQLRRETASADQDDLFQEVG